MVAYVKCVAVYSASDLADYYLRETEPQWQRNQDMENTFQMDPGEHEGTIPMMRRDVPDYVADRLHFRPHVTLTGQQVLNLIRGACADGEPTGRRLLNDYTREDGREYKTREIMDVTFSTDVSVGMALANAETPACRAIILNAAHAAADDAMHAFADKMAFTRRGAGGSGGTERGEIVWIRFTHHTTRPTQDGSVYPNLHFHHVVPSNVVLPDGKVRAMFTMKCHGHVKSFGNTFQDSFARYCRAAGINIKQFGPTNSVVFTDIPDSLRMDFARRGFEMEQFARERAEAAGQDWDKMPYKERHRLMRLGRNIMQGPKQDGMADPALWRQKLAQAGLVRFDVSKVQPRARQADAQPAGLAERARRLALGARQTWQAHRQSMERAALRQESAPSLKRSAAFSAALARPLMERAQRLRLAMETLANRSLMVRDRARKLTQRTNLNQAMAILPRMQQTLEGLSQRFKQIREGAPKMTNENNVSVINKKYDFVSVVGSSRQGRTVHQVCVTFNEDGMGQYKSKFHDAVFDRKEAADMLAEKVYQQGYINNNKWRDTEGSANFIPAPKQEAPQDHVGKTERMLRVYARKVHAGEISLSEAADTFAVAEERRDDMRHPPQGYYKHHGNLPMRPGHMVPAGTETVKTKDADGNPITIQRETSRFEPLAKATPDNRDERSGKWSNRIIEKVSALERGENIWPEVARGPDLQAQQRQTMRMGR